MSTWFPSTIKPQAAVVDFALAKLGDAMSSKKGLLTLNPGQQIHAIDGGWKTPLRVSRDAFGGFVEIPNGWLTVTENMPSSLTTGMGACFNQIAYIDPVNGSDTLNNGQSPSTPKKTLNQNGAWNGTPGWTGWNDGMCALIKRGTDYVHQGSATLAINNNQGIGSYGPEDVPKPSLRATYVDPVGGSSKSLILIGTPNGAMLADIVLDGQDVRNRHGVSVVAYAVTNQMKDCLVRGVEVKNVRQDVSANPADNYTWINAIQVIKSGTPNNNTAAVRGSNLRFEDLNIHDVGGHGIMLIGALGTQRSDGTWGGIDVIRCNVEKAGLDIDSHGITSYCDSTTSGKATWTNTTGNIWWCAHSGSTILNRQTDDVDTVYLTKASPSRTYILTKNSSTPTTPGLYEFGFDASTQRLYVNIGLAIDSANDNVETAARSPRGIRYIDCTVSGMILQNNTFYKEGHGFAFDDMVSDSSMIGCRSFFNAGAGTSSNRGMRNTFLRNQIIGNLGGQMGFGKGLGHLMENNIVIGGGPYNRVSPDRALVMFDQLWSSYHPTLRNRARGNWLHATENLDGYFYNGGGLYQTPCILEGNRYSKKSGVIVADICTGGKYFGR